jgi:hypothetical protein
MSYRDWLEQLRSVRGYRPLWPVLLGNALDAEFRRQVAIDEGYKGEVFIDRDRHPLEEGEREERQVAQLYRACHRESEGCVTIDDQRVWLLGFQWPNQGGAGQKGRRADLVGLTREGGLVVFEAKVAGGDAPLIALTEGLDYLACLLREKNFAKIVAGFGRWRERPERVVPVGFESTVPQKTLRPSLVIMAPERYYLDRHSRSIRSKDWPFLMAVSESMIPSVRILFAMTDFKSPLLIAPRQTA